MVEILRTTRSKMRAEDFLTMTGYSRSTTYRLLRTLTACKYTLREPGGFYRLNDSVVTFAQEKSQPDETGRLRVRHGATAEGHSGFERWGVQFRGDGRRVQEMPLGDRPETAGMGEGF